MQNELVLYKLLETTSAKTWEIIWEIKRKTGNRGKWKGKKFKKWFPDKEHQRRSYLKNRSLMDLINFQQIKIYNTTYMYNFPEVKGNGIRSKRM